MLSKSVHRARRRFAFALLAFAACSLPWSAERQDEVNIAFVLRNNQPIIAADIDNMRGTFVVSSAQPRSVLDPHFLQSRRISGNSRVALTLGDRHTVQLSVAPIDVYPMADGILGTDAWRGRTMTLDYRGQVMALSNRALPMDDMLRHRFTTTPRFPITIDGHTYDAIVDTAIPDTLLLPEAHFGAAGRKSVNARIAGTEFPHLDVAVGKTTEVRIGNRILANFLVTIDFRRGVVGLWRDPRQRPIRDLPDRNASSAARSDRIPLVSQ